MTAIGQMIADLVTEISSFDGVTTRIGISTGDLVLLEERLQLHLPEGYRELLLLTNGVELQFGATRIIGSGPGAPIDLEWFNHSETWKFAYRWWRRDLDDLLILGVTAECALTCCRRADLRAHNSDPPFFVVHPIGSKVLGGTDTVTSWFQRGLRGIAHHPRQDPEINRILDHFGQLPPDRVVMPPATDWLATDDDAEEAGDLEASVLLPVAEALIGQADLLRHSRELRPGDQVHGVDTWTDEQGRTRLRYRVTRSGR